MWATYDALFLSFDDPILDKINVKDPTGPYQLTAAAGTPFHSANRGIKGDGAAYYGTGFNPTTAVSPKLTRNSNNFWVYSGTDGAVAMSEFGQLNGTIAIAVRYNTNNQVVRISNTIAAARANMEGRGMFGGKRVNASTRQLTWNGQVASSAQASAALTNAQFMLMRGATPAITTRQVAGCAWGSYIDDTQTAAEYAAIEAYMVAVGASVPNLAPLMSTSALRQVANGCYCPSTNTGTGRSLNAISPHLAMEALSSFKIVLPNWSMAGTNDVHVGGDLTVSAAIEYPAGVFTQVTFGGNATEVSTTLENIVSDTVALAIPANTLFRVRLWMSGNGVSPPYINQSPSTANSAQGACFEINAGVLADKTMGGSVTAATNQWLTPVAIVQSTNRPAVYLGGASKGYGLFDTWDSANVIGEAHRGVGSVFGTINGCESSESWPSSPTGHQMRRLLATTYCTHVIDDHGSGELTNGDNAPTMLGKAQAYWGFFPGMPVFPCTIPPWTSSSDSWATPTRGQTGAGNQTVTPTATKENNRKAYNDLLRALPAGAAGYMDVADAVEAVRNGSYWYGPTRLTHDGQHEKQAGNLQIAAIRAVNPGQIRGY